MLRLDTGSKTSEQNVAHLIQLDSLRAFAVSGVLIHHFLPASIAIAPFGAMGVKLFFVLSGFLITGILLRCKDIAETTQQSIGLTLRRFYIRRFLRIFPLFYFVLLLAALVDIAPARQTFFWHATYLSNVYITKSGNWPGALSPFWTLAVEEQFYLVWPWVILYTERKHLAKLIILTVLSAPLFRLAVSLTGLNHSNWAVLPFACLDTLGLGALLAIFSDNSFGLPYVKQTFVRLALWVGVPLLLFDWLLYLFKLGESFSFISFDIAMGLVSVWLIASAAKRFEGVSGKILEFKPLVYMGTISYGIYVYHSFVQIFLDKALNVIRQRPLVVVYLIVGIALISIAALALRGFQYLLNVAVSLKPLLYIVVVGLTLVLVFYGAMKTELISLELMNKAIYFLLSSLSSIALAAISWQFLEMPINDLKERFTYRVR